MRIETLFRLEIFATLCQLVLIIVLLFLNFNDFKHKLRKVRWRTWLGLFVILIFGLVLRLEGLYIQGVKVGPDDTWHMDLAANIKLSFQEEPCYQNGMTRMGARLQTKCELRHSYLYTLSYPLFVFLFSFLFDFIQSGIFVSFVFGLLAILLMFFLSYLLFRNELVALFAALFFSFFPDFVKFSSAPNTYMISIFFIELSVVLVLLAVDLRTKKSLLLMCLVLVFTAMVRAENALLLALLIFFILMQKNVSKKKFLFCFLIALLFYIPFILFLFSPWTKGYVATVDPVFQFGSIPIKSIFYHIYFNIRYMAHFSFWLLCLLGFFYVFKSNRTNFYFLSSWFFVFFLFFLIYNGISQDYSLNRFAFSYIPLCIISAAGIFYLLQKISYIFHDRVRMVILILILLLILFFNINFLIHYVYAQDGLNDPSHNPYLIDIEGFVKPTTDRELTNVTEFRLSPNFESKTGKDLR